MNQQSHPELHHRRILSPDKGFPNLLIHDISSAALLKLSFLSARLSSPSSIPAFKRPDNYDCKVFKNLDHKSFINRLQ